MTEELQQEQSVSTGLEAKNKELIGEIRKLSQRVKDYEAKAAEAESLREAERQATHARAAAIERAMARTIAASGAKIPEKVFDVILSGAQSERAITVNEDGSVTGAREYLDAVIGALAPSSTAKPEAAQFPRPDPAKTSEPIGQFEAVKTFRDLVALGPAAMTKFHEAHRDRYEQLKAEHSQALANPQRQLPPTTVGTR